MKHCNSVSLSIAILLLIGTGQGGRQGKGNPPRRTGITPRSIIGRAQCPPGQRWHICKPCYRTCHQPHPYCSTVCIPGCGCPTAQPYWHNNRCCYSYQCPSATPAPVPRPSCPGDQQWHPCRPCYRTCKNRQASCFSQCTPGCGCPSHKPYWHNNRCCSLYECPVVITTTPAPLCPGGQQWHSCRPCFRTCWKRNPCCPYHCTPGCGCPAQKPYWHNSRCCSSTQCPIVTIPASTSVASHPSCPGDQHWHPCRPCTRTCTNRNPCCPTYCTPGCGCPANKPYWHGNRCCYRLQCDSLTRPGQPTMARVCPGDQQWYPCRPCFRTCSNPSPCCHSTCTAGCGCPEHKPYWHNNRCCYRFQCSVLVPTSATVPTIPACPSNQVWHTCKPCYKTCVTKQMCCHTYCTAGCACPVDKPYWLENRCCTHNQCTVLTPPAPTPPRPVCSGGQQWCLCKPCYRTCENRHPYCGTHCTPGCGCPSHKPYWHNHRCCSNYECPVVPTPPPTPIRACPGDQQWYPCRPCLRTCHNRNPKCPAICRPGCGCPSYKPYWNNKRCCHSKQCPIVRVCKGGRKWNKCGPRCIKTCKTPRPRCAVGCRQGCSCPSNFPIWRNGRCTASKNCPKLG